MKKLILLFLLIGIGLNTNAQKSNDYSINSLKRVGIISQNKDTLYLLDCKVAHLTKEFWNEMTTDELKSDGLEKKPILIIVKSFDKFKKIVGRIEKNEIG